jgi:hypothetical protein
MPFSAMTSRASCSADLPSALRALLETLEDVVGNVADDHAGHGNASV